MVHVLLTSDVADLDRLIARAAGGDAVVLQTREGACVRLVPFEMPAKVSAADAARDKIMKFPGRFFEPITGAELTLTYAEV